MTPGALLRDVLATLRPASSGGAWSVDGLTLSPDHPAGRAPWVAGTDVVRGVGGRPVARRALEAELHLAVVDGPDAGAVTVAGRDGRVVVGRAGDGGPGGTGGPGGQVPGRLDLSDPAVSREHLVITLRRPRRGLTPRRVGRAPAEVRDLGSRNGTVVVRGPSGRRRPGASRREVRVLGHGIGGDGGRGGVRRRGRGARTGVRLRDGDLVVLGASVLAVRPAGRPCCEDGPATADVDAEPAPRTPSPATWLPGMLVPLALAITLRHPLLLAAAVAVPLATLLPAWFARRRGGRALTPGAAGGGGPSRGSSARVPARVPGRTSPRIDAPALSLAVLDRPGSRGPCSTEHPGTLAREWWSEGVALVGEEHDVRAVARAQVVAVVVSGTDVVLPDGPEWAWARWLHGCVHPQGAVLQVRDALAGPELREDPAPPAGQEAHGHLVLCRSEDVVPPDVRRVLRVTGSGRGPRSSPVEALGTAHEWVVHDRWDGSVHPLSGGPPARGSTPWAEWCARRLAAGPPGSHGRGRLPELVAPEELGLPVTAADIERRWRAASGLDGLPLPLGLAALGPTDVRPLVLDLVADGPHMLVAGTTGSGKSELLQSVVLAAALTLPPERLVLVLLDFKSGASLGPCRHLPHVVGLVTDVDVPGARRALAGLRRELRRRAALLAEAGAVLVSDLPAPRRPPLLLVVVDEFRALTEDAPELLPDLVRLATQGRALGMHLVLATQRPAGTVDGQLRANLGIRVCLRVADVGDSHDVLDRPDAAHLPVSAPGRALVRTERGLQEVQTSWSAVRRPVRTAPVVAVTAGPLPVHEVDAARPSRLVQEARRAAAHRTAPAGLWLPALPASVPSDRVSDHAPIGVLTGGRVTGLDRTDSCTLRLALADHPTQGARVLVAWDPRTGALGVAGGPRTGRTTALAVVASQAIAVGHRVVLLDSAVRGPDLAETLGRPAPSTVPAHERLDPQQTPARCARRIADLVASPSEVTTLLVVDDLGGLLRALDRLPRGLGAAVWDQALDAVRRQRLALAVTGSVTDLHRLGPSLGDRVVLGPVDATDATVLGLPRTGLPHQAPPGRGWHLSGGLTTECQVLEPPASVRSRPSAGPGHGSSAGPPPRPASPLSRAAGPRGSLSVLLGHDDATAPVHVALTSGVLVVGPRRSGRTTALDVLGAGARAAGHRVDRAPASPTALLETLRGLDGGTVSPSTTRRVLVVDDVDLLLRGGPAVEAALLEVLARSDADDPSAPVLLMSARTDRAAADLRGVLATARRQCVRVVLVPAEPGSREVAGEELGLLHEPGERVPGRGVLVTPDDGTAVVQVSPPGPDVSARSSAPPPAGS